MSSAFGADSANCGATQHPGQFSFGIGIYLENIGPVSSHTGSRRQEHQQVWRRLLYQRPRFLSDTAG